MNRFVASLLTVAALTVATPAVANSTVHEVQLDIAISFGEFLNLDLSRGPHQIMDLPLFCKLNDVDVEDCLPEMEFPAFQPILFQTG